GCVFHLRTTTGGNLRPARSARCKNSWPTGHRRNTDPEECTDSELVLCENSVLSARTRSERMWPNSWHPTSAAEGGSCSVPVVTTINCDERRRFTSHVTVFSRVSALLSNRGSIACSSVLTIAMRLASG